MGGLRKKSKQCNMCGKPIYPNQSSLCKECLISDRQAKFLQAWFNTGILPYGVSTTIRGVVRKFLLDSQYHKCAICGIEEIWNDKPLHFVLDHIDGNASNNCSNNLRMVCPNCDSQLDTYKARNKKSARVFRNK